MKRNRFSSLVLVVSSILLLYGCSSQSSAVAKKFFVSYLHFDYRALEYVAKDGIANLATDINNLRAKAQQSFGVDTVDDLKIRISDIRVHTIDSNKDRRTVEISCKYRLKSKTRTFEGPLSAKVRMIALDKTYQVLAVESAMSF